MLEVRFLEGTVGQKCGGSWRHEMRTRSRVNE